MCVAHGQTIEFSSSIDYIRDCICAFLTDNELLTDKQHGFSKARSCQTKLLESFEEWTAALDEHYAVDVIYLDFKKAFDSVPHQRLLSKIKLYMVLRATYLSGFPVFYIIVYKG